MFFNIEKHNIENVWLGKKTSECRSTMCEMLIYIYIYIYILY